MLSSRVSKLMKLKTLNCQHIYSTIHAFVKLQSQWIRCLADFRRHFFSLSHTASVSSSLRQRWNWRVIHQWNVASSNSLNRRGWANKARESPPSAENFIRNSNWSRAKPSVFVWCKYTPWVLKYPATEQSNYPITRNCHFGNKMRNKKSARLEFVLNFYFLFQIEERVIQPRFRALFVFANLPILSNPQRTLWFDAQIYMRCELVRSCAHTKMLSIKVSFSSELSRWRCRHAAPN